MLAEQVSAEVHKNGRSDSGLQTAVAGRVGVDGVFVVAAPLSIVAGVEATIRAATRVHVGLDYDGATRNLEAGALAGIRFDL